MTAREVFCQNDGQVTRDYYAELSKRGSIGEIAVALFRAQKRSAAAKRYRGGRYRREAYDVKSYSIGELCRLLGEHGAAFGFAWGWKADPSVPFGDQPSQVLYVDIPHGIGQCSFHSPTRGAGPDYPGEWDREHKSEERILAFADLVMLDAPHYAPEQTERQAEATPPPPPPPPPPPSPPPPARLVFGDPNSIAMARQHGQRRQR